MGFNFFARTALVRIDPASILKTINKKGIIF